MTHLSTDLTQLVSEAPEIEFAPGEFLIQENEPLHKLYVLIEGEVEVSKDGTEICKISRRGSTFGEMSALLGDEPSASVQAVQATKLYVIENPLEFLENNPKAALEVARLLAYRVNWVTFNFAEAKKIPSPDEVRSAMADSFAKRVFSLDRL